jgi:hypothetical protein
MSVAKKASYSAWLTFRLCDLQVQLGTPRRCHFFSARMAPEWHHFVFTLRVTSLSLYKPVKILNVPTLSLFVPPLFLKAKQFLFH